MADVAWPRKKQSPTKIPSRTDRTPLARVYLERGGLLESPRRGRFIISPRGREVLNAQPARIDLKFLAHCPEFREFQKAKRETEEPTTQMVTPHVADAEAPEDELEAAHGRMKGIAYGVRSSMC